MFMLMCGTFTALAVDYALGGYLNGQDVNNYDGNWKFTKSGSNYVLTKTFSKTDNYFWVFDSNGTKYGAESYTENNPSTLKQGANEKVGAKGLSTSSATTITFNPSTKQISWSTSGGGGTTTSDMYIIGDAVGGWDNFLPMTKGTNNEYYYEGVTSGIEFKFTTKSSWGGDSETLFNESSEDNSKNVGSSVAKVQNGNDTNLKVTLNSGYTQPITFYVSSSSKKFWVVATADVKFTLKSDLYSYDIAKVGKTVNEINLTVDVDSKTTGNYIWYSSTDKNTFTKIKETTTNTLKIEGDDIPLVPTYYKVERKKTSGSTMVNSIIKIDAYSTCAENTKGSPIFEITFDDDSKLTKLIGEGSRMSYDGLLYSYKEAPGKIIENEYAIVTDPLYCGCGDGLSDEGKREPVTEDCIKEKNNRWYRSFRDHTQQRGGVQSHYGGMLLINFGPISATNEESGVAFSRILTPQETEKFTNGCVLNFSAYMASAAVKEKPGVTFLPINAELRIQHRDSENDPWVTRSFIKSDVDYDDEWMRFQTDFTIVDEGGQYRLVIKNNGSTGDGNDLLIDDISLTLCSPTISVEFEDSQDASYTFKNLDEEKSIRVPKVDFGSITEPCLMLFGLNEAGDYSYIAEMQEDGEYYVAKNAVSGAMLVQINDDGTRTLGAMKLQAVVSNRVSGDCSDEVMQGVQNGDYTPGSNPLVVFSSNTLSVNIECQESQLILLEGEPTSICYSKTMILPELKLTLDNIASAVSLDIMVNDELVLGGIAFEPTEEGSNEMILNISQLYEERNGAKYLPAVGNQEVTVKVTESYADGVICERFAQGDVTIKVTGKSDKPVLLQDGDEYAYNMCKTVGADPLKVDDKFFFNDLVAQPTDKSTLVWLTKDNQPIAKEDAFLYADTVHVDSVKVFNYPSDGCPSDTIVVRYRVKEITPAPQFVNYKECATEETSKPLSDLVTNASTYKYLLFLNEDSVAVTTFNPSAVGEADYKIIASLDEIKSAENNNCEATAELTVKVKAYATAANIIANDTLVCPNAELVLLAKADFAEEQTNVKLTWYSDTTYNRIFAYGETFKYFVLDEAYKQSPDTVYVTVQSDDYCENIPLEAKPVIITQREAVPSLAITPASAEVVIGAMPEFTVTPEGAKYDLYVNDVKVSSDATTYKPYLNSEYKLVYQGDCGTSSATAHVAVQWPTVFTPYVQDGRNDTFVQDMNPNFYTQIFTRFGTKIYEGENGWDGSINGSMNGSKEVAAPGVYYYVVQLPDGNVKKGTIEVFKY